MVEAALFVRKHKSGEGGARRNDQLTRKELTTKFWYEWNQMRLAMLNKLINIKRRLGQDLQKYFLQGKTHRREVEGVRARPSPTA